MAYDPSTYSTVSGKNLHYVVLQVTLKEKLIGTGSGNLTALEQVINGQARATDYTHFRRHTQDSKGLMGGEENTGYDGV